MIVTYRVTEGQEPTPEQIAEIEAARLRPIVYDEDSPALTPEAIEGFQCSAVERNRKKQKAREMTVKSVENVS